MSPCPTNGQLDSEDDSVLGLIFCKSLVLICSLLNLMSVCLFGMAAAADVLIIQRRLQNGNILLLEYSNLCFLPLSHLLEHFYKYSFPSSSIWLLGDTFHLGKAE